MEFRRCAAIELPAIGGIINAAAEAYRGVIAPDCWHEPYMPADELRQAVADGVVFWGCCEAGALTGVMGLQGVLDVTLIRHAYVKPERQRRGVASALLSHLSRQVTGPMLVGTWREAAWAVQLYRRQGFTLVSDAEKDRLLRAYWKVSERQAEESVVLVDSRWIEARNAP